MAAGNWIVYNKAKEYMADGTIDLDTHTFKVHLVNGYTPALTHQVLATGPIATAPSSNGGTTDFTLTGVTWAATTGSAAVMRFDSSATATWTAAGGTMNATHAIIYDDTPTSPADPLLCYCDLNTATSGPVAVTSGNTLSVIFATATGSTGGIFTLGGATS